RAHFGKPGALDSHADRSASEAQLAEFLEREHRVQSYLRHADSPDVRVRTLPPTQIQISQAWHLTERLQACITQFVSSDGQFFEVWQRNQPFKSDIGHHAGSD